jgi:hypothetical protein
MQILSPTNANETLSLVEDEYLVGERCRGGETTGEVSLQTLFHASPSETVRNRALN